MPIEMAKHAGVVVTPWYKSAAVPPPTLCEKNALMTTRTDSFDATLPPIVRILMFTGALPFVGSAIASMSNASIALLGLPPNQLALSYGLVILSFMAGALWGYQLSQPPAVTRELLKTNLVTVLAWLGSLYLNTQLALFLLAAGFIYLLWMDSCARRISRISTAYLRLRTLITGVVVISLVTVALT